MTITVLTLILIGLLTGTVTAISAGSGVAIVVPLLVILLGADIYSAIGTSLFVDVIASINVAYHYYRFGRIDLRSGMWLGISAVAGALIGSHFAHYIPQQGLNGAFSIFIIISGITFIVRAYSKRHISLSRFKFENKKGQILMLLGIGLYIGISTGLFGTGGGATILLVLVYILDYPLHTAIGTATALMAISAASGTIGYATTKHVLWVDGVIIGVAAMFSGMLFSRFANKVSEKTLNVLVGLIFIAIGVSMFFVEGGTAGLLQSIHSLVSR